MDPPPGDGRSGAAEVDEVDEVDPITPIGETGPTAVVEVLPIEPPVPAPPVVEVRADARFVEVPAEVELWASASDPDGGEVTLSWELVLRPPSSTARLMPDAIGTAAVLYVDHIGEYAVVVTATDDDGVTAEMGIAVFADASNNLPPLVDAGRDRTIWATAPLTLNAEGSTDPEDGHVSDYIWYVIAAPERARWELLDPEMLQPTFIAETAGVYVLEVEGRDSLGATTTDSLEITVLDNCPVRIAEVYYDAIGADQDAFIELCGPPGLPLDGLSLAAYNGADRTRYADLELWGDVPDDGVFVVASPASSFDVAAVADAVDTRADLQNGPDGVVLLQGGRAVDSLRYGRFDAGLAFTPEGAPALDVPPGFALARRGACVDSDDNRRDFARVLPTAGRVPHGAGL